MLFILCTWQRLCPSRRRHDEWIPFFGIHLGDLCSTTISDVQSGLLLAFLGHRLSIAGDTIDAYHMNCPMGTSQGYTLQCQANSFCSNGLIFIPYTFYVSFCKLCKQISTWMYIYKWHSFSVIQSVQLFFCYDTKLVVYCTSKINE